MSGGGAAQRRHGRQLASPPPSGPRDAVRRLQRALRRTPILGLAVDGVVGPLTWAALPDGRPMPTLEEGSIGAVVRSLQEVLLNRASGRWYTAPGAFDGEFGPYTKVSVQAFQTWGGVKADGVVGDQTWAVSLRAASATLETAVGLQFVSGSGPAGTRAAR